MPQYLTIGSFKQHRMSAKVHPLSGSIKLVVRKHPSFVVKESIWLVGGGRQQQEQVPRTIKQLLAQVLCMCSLWRGWDYENNWCSSPQHVRVPFRICPKSSISWFFFFKVTHNIFCICGAFAYFLVVLVHGSPATQSLQYYLKNDEAQFSTRKFPQEALNF